MAERWSGRVGFILATVGSAVGLGSIWKFPYEVGTNGGGVFVLFYLAGIVLIVVPLLLVEFAVGRRGRSDAAASIRNVARAHGASPLWAAVGALGVLTAFLILSFYAVVGGWALAYALETPWRDHGASAGAVQARFDGFMAAPLRMAGYQALFLGLTAIIVGRGVTHGIEAAVRWLMPLLVGLLLLLAVYSVIAGGIARTAHFMFAPDFAKFTPRVAIEALGLGFFSIGVGIGVMIVYAAYARANISLREVAAATVIGDTAISFVAGFAVFPIVFAEGLDPASGPGLMFVTLPLAFAQMPLGAAAAVGFFLLLTVAGLASAISLLEMPVAFLMRRWQLPRAVATAAVAAACFVVGLGTVFSFNLWWAAYPLAFVPGLRTATFYDALDHLTSNLMMPLGGLLLAIFAGWVLPADGIAKELSLSAVWAIAVRALLRYVVPLGILAATLAPYLL
jgi:NSS family neurotransmitter:Na+ symporter